MKSRNGRISKVDEKGRIFIPNSIKKGIRFGEKLVLTNGFEPCIYAFTEEKWKNVEKTLEGVSPFSQTQEKNAARYIYGSAEDVELDKQGRILIPGHLAEFAKITREVYFVKMMWWFEIWNPENYRIYMENHPIDNFKLENE